MNWRRSTTSGSSSAKRRSNGPQGYAIGKEALCDCLTNLLSDGRGWVRPGACPFAVRMAIGGGTLTIEFEATDDIKTSKKKSKTEKCGLIEYEASSLIIEALDEAWPAVKEMASHGDVTRIFVAGYGHAGSLACACLARLKGLKPHFGLQKAIYGVSFLGKGFYLNGLSKKARKALFDGFVDVSPLWARGLRRSKWPAKRVDLAPLDLRSNVLATPNGLMQCLSSMKGSKSVWFYGG